VRFFPRWAVLALMSMFSFGALGQRIAFTFDDGLDPARQPKAAEWTNAMLAALADAKVRAMHFPASSSIGDTGMPLVARWSQAGHAIGNHTARHRNLASSKLSLQDFIGDVEAGDARLRVLPTFRPMLRFPYLKEGDTVEKRDGVRAWMRDHGYRPAPVSIDASDWYYSAVFAKLPLDDDAKRARLMGAYVRHLLDRAGYYDTLAKKVTGRSPAHILLLHTNAINAAWLPQVMRAFQANGWTIVPAVEAFDDPIYREQPDVLPAGESIVWSLAKQAGEPALRYPAEDSVYEEPLLRQLGLP
jgi:peptidoglycan/xylan/chitin deacetylase (PgdA/CDA1 family)